MTKYILSLAIAALLVAGCGNKGNEHSHDGEGAHEHTEGMHKHEDGSVHEDHHDEHHQEEFKVESDSSVIKEEKEKEKEKEHEHGHSHEDGSHKH